MAAPKSPHDALLLCGTQPKQAAIRMGEWKLLMGASDNDAEESPTDGLTSGKVALYNLATDLGEQKNLAAEQPEKVKELRARLDAFLRNSVAPGPVAIQHKKEK